MSFLMSASPTIGWYIYTPTDPKKSKLTLRWATVNDFWLEISPKPSEPPILTIHLGFTEFYPIQTENNTPVNALQLKTDSIVGSFSIILSTNNRFDILDLNQALVQGKDCWRQLNENGPQLQSLDLVLKDRKSGIFSNKNIECSISDQGFKTQRTPAETAIYTFNQISYVRPVYFDARQGSCFEVSIDLDQQKIELLLQCHNHDEMIKFLLIFTYYLSKSRQE